MRKLITTVLFVLSTIVAFSQASPSELNFGSPAIGAQTITLSINANANWVVTSYPSWVTIDKQSGKGPATISVTVIEDNPSDTDPRIEVLSIYTTMGNQSQEYRIGINQVAHLKPIVTLSKTTIPVSFNYDVIQTSNFSINSNYTWTATADSWIELYNGTTRTGTGDVGETDLNIKLYQNPTESPRTGTITFYSSDVVKTVTIQQAASKQYYRLYSAAEIYEGKNPMTSDTIRVAWDATGNSTAMYFTGFMTDFPYLSTTAGFSTYNPSVGGVTNTYWDWTAKQSSVYGFKPTSINTSGQPRSFSFQINTKDGKSPRTITVLQETKPVPLPVITLAVTQLGISNVVNTSSDFSFGCDNPWTVTTPSWITILDESNAIITSGAAGTYIFKASALTNPTSESRTGTITFTSGSVSKSIIVGQAGQIATAMQDAMLNNTVSVYPNPSSGQISISGSFTIANIFNSKGTIIQTSNSPVISLPQGFYLFEVLSDKGERTTHKVIIE